MLQARRGTSSLYKPRYLNALGDGGALIQRLEAVVKEAARWPFYPNTLNSSNSSSEGCDGEGCGNAQSSGRQAPVARAAYTGAGAFCEPTFASMTDAKSERQRAACTGACALLELAGVHVHMHTCIHTCTRTRAQAFCMKEKCYTSTVEQCCCQYKPFVRSMPVTL